MERDSGEEGASWKDMEGSWEGTIFCAECGCISLLKRAGARNIPADAAWGNTRRKARSVATRVTLQ